MPNSKQSAFPRDTNEIAANSHKYTKHHPGLSKREYFAAIAMQGMLSNHTLIDTLSTNAYGVIAQCALCQADELLKQLEK